MARALIDERPALSGPSGPPRLISMIVSGGLLSAPNNHAGRNTNAVTTAMCAIADAPSIDVIPSLLGARATRTSLTASIYVISAPFALQPRFQSFRRRPLSNVRTRPLIHSTALRRRRAETP